jgi:hypothetical protein
MRTDDSSETIEGRFWLPDDRHRSYGRIDYDPVEGVRVHLVDTNLGRRTENGRLEGPGYVDVVHGETLGGTPLTLLGVYPTRSTRYGFGPSGGDIVDAFASALIKGAHLMQIEDVSAQHYGLTMFGLKEFLTGGTVELGPLRPGTEDDDSSDRLKVPLPDGVELLLVASRRRSFSFDRQASELEASAGFTFDSPRSLPEVDRDYIQALQDLVLFATRRHCHVTSLSANGDHPYDSVRVIRRPYPRPREAADVYALALNLSEHGDPAKIVADWYSLRQRIGPVWNVFFAALDRPESLLEDRFLGLLSFAEGYHRAIHDRPPLTRAQERAANKAIKQAIEDDTVRRVYKQALAHANSETQRERLDFLIGRAMDVLEDLWYLDRELFASQLIHTRNWLVHWGSRGKQTVEANAGMVELVRSMIVILYVNLLLDLGFDGDAAARVVGSGWRLEELPDPPWEASDEGGSD